jgi:hypothetical protein
MIHATGIMAPSSGSSNYATTFSAQSITDFDNFYTNDAPACLNNG